MTSLFICLAQSKNNLQFHLTITDVSPERLYPYLLRYQKPKRHAVSGNLRLLKAGTKHSH